jgi:hypothetical protein
MSFLGAVQILMNVIRSYLVHRSLVSSISLIICLVRVWFVVVVAVFTFLEDGGCQGV